VAARVWEAVTEIARGGSSIGVAVSAVESGRMWGIGGNCRRNWQGFVDETCGERGGSGGGGIKEEGIG